MTDSMFEYMMDHDWPWWVIFFILGLVGGAQAVLWWQILSA